MSETGTTRPDVRSLGLACACSGVLMAAMALLLFVHADVPKDQWSYPQSPGLLLVSGLFLGVAHLLSAAGLVGVLRLDAAPTTTGRLGLRLAVTGCYVLTVGEWISAFIGKKSNNSGVATTTSTIFGVASIMFAVGAISAGVVILRRGTWPAPWSWVVLATGVVIVALVTPANISGNVTFREVSLLIWSVLFIPLGLDVARGLRSAHGHAGGGLPVAGASAR